MTITKKQWMMLLLGAGVLFLVYWFFFRNKLKENTESSYDEDLMIFGNENGYKSGSGNGVIVQTVSGACPCDDTVTGTCFRPSPSASSECKGLILHIPEPSMVASANSESNFIKVTGGISWKSRCRKAGGTPGECWNDGAGKWVRCCAKD